MNNQNKYLIIERKDFPQFFDVLKKRGYDIIAPTIRDQVIVYDGISSIEDLPIGWTDEQDGGYYRLKRRNDQALFGYVVGPISWKKFLYPPAVKIMQAHRNQNNGFSVEPVISDSPSFAFLGVRSCELKAIAVQDKVFVDGRYADPVYKSRREKLFIIAINCGKAANTCFCTSMNSGPKVTSGFDIALTEIIQNDRHFFVAETGTSKGAEILSEMISRPAREDEVALQEQTIAQAASQIKRTLNTQGIKELLYRHYEHPQWEKLAERCLSCGNCTLVCPTCFCSTVEDVTDLTGEHAERWRKWDSCFVMDFSYIHGGYARSTVSSRYRQWMTHKLASWQDQFGMLGCVGCGRCISWCPVGIDLTQEARLIRENQNT